jgi:hypothetical protein
MNCPRDILSSEEVFRASYVKRNSIGSLIRPKRPKLTFPWHKSKQSSSAPVSPVDREDASNAPAATIDTVSRSTSQDNAVHGAFRLAHEAEVSQGFVVRALENSITVFKRKVCSDTLTFHVLCPMCLVRKKRSTVPRPPLTLHGGS